MLPEKESQTVEFKSDKSRLSDQEIFEAVVAMANTDGGDIFLGVENDGTVSGVHKTHENPITLGALIANNTVPPVSVRTEIVDSIKPVLRISVPKSHGGVVATASGKILRRRLKLDGTPENIPMYPTELTTRLTQLSLLDHSAMPVSDSSVEDFDPLEIERLRKIILSYDGDKTLLELRNEDIYKALGLAKEIDNHLVPTVTGLLMIGKVSAIKVHLPTHLLSFQVLTGSRVVNNEELINA